MSLFDEITKKHVTRAIQMVDDKEFEAFPNSKYYDLLFNKKRYPPKVIMAKALELATGRNVLTTEFKGGHKSPAFKKLELLGFKIVEKDSNSSSGSFSSQLHKFLSQVLTTNLKTKGYVDSYENLKVKVSFGQGAAARIPWISFLGKGQSTSDGIYPVYLYYKEEELLILAYGVSETNTPSTFWDQNNKETITDFFENRNKKPARYGGSFVFREYQIDQLPSDDQLDSDLNKIIVEYKELLKADSDIPVPSNEKDFNIESFLEGLRNAGLIFSKAICTRFVGSLITKPFVILSGLSGSGKTKLALSFIKWICQDDSQYVIIPVGADWTNREPLLGFPNALSQNEYIEPDSGVLRLIQNAKRNPKLPFFLVLDEMNLSHVERYFADFLSVMESGEPIHLHSLKDCNVPNNVVLPDNLFIVGTVNIDETTYMFSPKVLDRANTIEFRVNKDEMLHFLRQNEDVNPDKLVKQGTSMATSLMQLTRDKSAGLIPDIEEKMVAFFVELKEAGAEYGYRTANEIQILLSQLEKIDSSLTHHQRLDIAVIQKLLPKLHGSRRKLEKVLFALCRLCVSGGMEESKVNQYLMGDIPPSDSSVLFPISLEKIQRMYKGAIEHGFASYAEA